ncbi:MAG: hypothetical protein DRJ64_02860 [Thermoprotei archaeon]|nr:MAG: hypothetical protein DRJ64_02860 [Thermoprotei archaeon]
MKKLETEGYVVKSAKQGEHTHGRWFTGNLYNGSVKIAEFEEHGWGGPMDIHIKNEDMFENFVSFARTMEDSDYSEIDAILIEDMVNSFFDRKMVMAGRKKKTYFVVKNGDLESVWENNTPYNEGLVNALRKEYGDRLVGFGNEIFDIYPDGVDRIIRDEVA